jgi:hypothetical protein
LPARILAALAMITMVSACGGDPLAGRPVAARNQMHAEDTSTTRQRQDHLA